MVGYFQDAAGRAYDGGGEEALRGLRRQSAGGILQGGAEARFRRQENQKGDAVVQQGAAFWKSLGLTFPLEGVLERN
jgi:hypothetical protein